MQTVQLKYDIISWVTEVDDIKLIQKLYEWIQQQTAEAVSVEAIEGIFPPKRKGSLTEGYGIWADDAPFYENNYRDMLWQTEKNVW